MCFSYSFDVSNDLFSYIIKKSFKHFWKKNITISCKKCQKCYLQNNVSVSIWVQVGFKQFQVIYVMSYVSYIKFSNNSIKSLKPLFTSNSLYKKLNSLSKTKKDYRNLSKKEKEKNNDKVAKYCVINKISQKMKNKS